MKNKKLIFRWIGVIVLLILAIVLAGTVTARAVYQTNDDGVCWYWMNKAHEGAEITRGLGGDNEAVLAYFGRQWTEWNDLRKEIVQQKQEEAKRKEQEERAQWVSRGTYHCTFYAEDSQGARPNLTNVPYETIACNDLPLGTKVYIDGIGYRTVTDRGASTGSWSWHNSHWCDVYVGSNSEAYARGNEWHELWVIPS